MPHAKYFLKSRSAYAGTGSTTQSAPASSQPAPHQRLIHTNPHSAAYAISTAQDCHPKVWSNSSSGIGAASTRALCNNRSFPASAVRRSVYSNSSSGIDSKTASKAANCCRFIYASGEPANAIAGAAVGSPTYTSVCRTVAAYVVSSVVKRVCIGVAHGVPRE